MCICCVPTITAYNYISQIEVRGLNLYKFIDIDTKQALLFIHSHVKLHNCNLEYILDVIYEIS